MVRKTIILFISLLFFIGCSSTEAQKYAMDIYVENNTSFIIDNINIKYSGDRITVKSIKSNEIVQKTAYIGGDTSFNIKFNLNGKEVEVKNVGYYYFGGQDNVKITLNKYELIEKVSNSKDLIGYK